MKVLEIREYGQPLEIAERPTPVAGPAEVLVKVRHCALAVGEKLVQSGGREKYLGRPYPLPHVAGFQGAGRIAEVGDGVRPGLKGQSVVINGVLGCGDCSECRRGTQNRCAQRSLLGLEPGSQGCLAEYVSVPADNVHKWPAALDFHLAPFVSELATAYHMARRAKIAPGDTVVCIGAGQTGVMAIPVARMLGATTVLSVDREAERLAVATRLGATHTIDASTQDVQSVVHQLTGGVGADVSLEMVGHPETIELAIRTVGTFGRVALLGIQGPVVLDLPDYSELVISRELRLLGCFGKGDADFSQVVSLLDGQVLDIARLPYRAFSYHEIGEAWDMATRATQERVLVSFPEEVA